MTRPKLVDPAPKRVVIYTRVSRDDTGQGKSNDRQEAEARRLCEYKRWEIVEVVRDVSVSASTGKKRAGWERVLTMIKEGDVDYVVAWHMDRMTRSMLDLEELIVLCDQFGVGIATVAGDIDLTSDMGRMVARILAAVARAEVERKSARQKLANAARAKEGQAHQAGVRPFGYAEDRVTVIPAEAAAIKQGAADALSGMPLTAVAQRWVDKGLISSRAEKNGTGGWSARGVKNVLVNPRYAGIRTYLGQEVGVGAWEPILDLDTHLALVNMLNDPTRTLGSVHTGRIPATLLTSLAHCGTCGKPAKAASVRGRLTYACRPTAHFHTPRHETDALVLAALCDRLRQPDFLMTITTSSDVTGSVQEARAEILVLRERLATMGRLFAAGTIDEDQLASGTDEIKGRLTMAEKVLTSQPEVNTLRGLAVGTDKVIDEVLALPLDRQRALVDQWLDITMVGAKKKRNVPIKDQVQILAK